MQDKNIAALEDARDELVKLLKAADHVAAVALSNALVNVVAQLQTVVG